MCGERWQAAAGGNCKAPQARRVFGPAYLRFNRPTCASSRPAHVFPGPACVSYGPARDLRLQPSVRPLFPSSRSSFYLLLSCPASFRLLLVFLSSSSCPASPLFCPASPLVCPASPLFCPPPFASRPAAARRCHSCADGGGPSGSSHDSSSTQAVFRTGCAPAPLHQLRRPPPGRFTAEHPSRPAQLGIHRSRLWFSDPCRSGLVVGTMVRCGLPSLLAAVPMCAGTFTGMRTGWHTRRCCAACGTGSWATKRTPRSSGAPAPMEDRRARD